MSGLTYDPIADVPESDGESDEEPAGLGCAVDAEDSEEPDDTVRTNKSIVLTVTGSCDIIYSG